MSLERGHTATLTSQPGSRVGFARVEVYQTHARLLNGSTQSPTTLPMGEGSDPRPNPMGNPTRWVTHRAAVYRSCTVYNRVVAKFI